MAGRRRAPEAAELYADLVRVVHAIAQDGARELRAHGLTPAQYQVLVAARERAGLTQQALADRLGVTKGNVSQLVTRLHQAGLVDRLPAGARNELTLTDRGRDLVDRLVPAHRRFLDRRLAALSAEERATLHTLVTRLAPPD